MHLKERVKMIREDYGTQKGIAEAAKVGLRTWQQYEEGLHDPSWKVVAALSVLGYSTDWLATGNGKMKRGNVTYPLTEGLKTTDIGGELGVGFVQIPRYEVAASAGGGALINSEQIVDHLSFRSDWVRNALGVPVSSLALINVIGDSMEPTLSEGDLILIDMSHRGVKDNAVYVLQLAGELLVKRIQRKLDGSVVVRSDNTIYDSETVASEMMDSLNVIGRVVWCGRRM